MEKKRSKWFWIFLILFLAAAVFAFSYHTNRKKNEQIYEDLAQRNKEQKTEVTTPADDTPAKPKDTPKDIPKDTLEEPVEIPIDFEGLKAANPEIYAWIRIPGTLVDYPIVQRPGDDAYYLNHTIEGAEGMPGSIYTESLNSQAFTDKNTVIYGHNMKDGTMFGNLKDYQDRAYMDANSEIIIYTPEHIFTYKIFGAVTYDNRHIMAAHDFTEDAEYQEFLDSLNEVRNMHTYINPDIQVTTQDRIITLSTCNGSNEQRFLVEAVLTDEK